MFWVMVKIRKYLNVIEKLGLGKKFFFRGYVSNVDSVI